MKFKSACVMKREDRGDRWMGYLRYKTEDGKWRQLAKSFPKDIKTKKAAEEYLLQWRVSMEVSEQKADLPNSQSSVADYVDTYIDTLEKSGNVSAHTASDYRYIAKRIRKEFADTSMADLTTNAVQRWENDLTESGMAAATVIKMHRVLDAAFKHAVAVRDVAWNPCTAVKKPRRKTPAPNSLTAEGTARLAVTLDGMQPSALVTAATIALHTGMRQGEVCGLRWREYDPNELTINVVESIGRAPGGDYTKEPKTKSSRRKVPVDPMLANMLERRRKAMLTELEEAGIALSAEEFGRLYVIGYTDGRFYSPPMLSRQWRGLSESLGLRGTQQRKITFHDLRHSFATRAVAAGAPLKAVADVLGHSSIAITADIYADADEEAKSKAVSTFQGSILAQGNVLPYTELAN